MELCMIKTSTRDVCLILLTEIGALEIPSNSASWLNTCKYKSRNSQLCKLNTNPAYS